MLERYQGVSREGRLAIGLSYEPTVAQAAEWLVGKRGKAEREPDHQNLIRYLEYTYGIEKDVIDKALDIAELRIIERFKDG